MSIIWKFFCRSYKLKPIFLKIWNLCHLSCHFVLQTLHRLAARAVIKDWENGSLNEDRTKHEMLKREMKDKIIKLSIDHSIVTQFTSFVAIEEREDGEKFDPTEGPSITELVEKENVDLLSYMVFDVDEEKSEVSSERTDSEDNASDR